IFLTLSNTTPNLHSFPTRRSSDLSIMKIRLTLLSTCLFFIASITAISFAQRTRDNDQPIRGDFKITIKQSFGGQEMQSSTMIKGQRERSETSMNVPGMPAGMNMG